MAELPTIEAGTGGKNGGADDPPSTRLDGSIAVELQVITRT
jgi:hypothetical protein